MIRPRLFLALLLLLPGLAGFGSPLGAAQSLLARPYHSAATLDLVPLLAPPPDQRGPVVQAELASMRKMQAARSMAQVDACMADQEISPFRFADVLGSSFTAAALPKTKALFDRILASTRGPVDSAKDHWARPRPPLADTRIKPCVKLPSSGSYPSGHSAAGYLAAMVLARMVPEKAGELYTRGRLFGDHRVLGGVHYPSDVEAGRMAATAFAAALFSDPGFEEDLAGAKAELRPALGMTR